MQDIQLSVKMLYRMFVVCTMLREVKLKNRGTAHNYPKMQLANMLVLEYWRTIDFYAIKMMYKNMSIMNEELGESTFSFLGRATLGDSHRSDFQHMRKLYSLIPIYRDVKEEIHSQTGRKDTHNYHHNIAENDEAVVLAGVFFKALVRGVRDDVYKCYDAFPAHHKNRALAAEHLTEEYVPLVYQPDHVAEILPKTFASIGASVSVNFLRNHSDLWPFDPEDVKQNDNSDSDDSSDYDQLWGAPFSGCRVGSYAVAHCDFPDIGFGLAVYCISSVPVYDKETQEYRFFMGKQLRCSLRNSDPRCVTDGIWADDSRRPTEKVHDWEVIDYFPTLSVNGKLPDCCVSVIHTHSKSHSLFGGADL